MRQQCKQQLTEENSELVREYLPMAGGVVRRMHRSMQLPEYLLEDMIAAGMLGLVDAASRYRKESGKSFRALAVIRIRGAAVDFLRKSQFFSARSYAKVKKLAEDSGESVREQFIRIVGESAIYEKGVADEMSPVRAVLVKERSEQIQSAIAELSDQEKHLIQEYYFAKKPLAEIKELKKKLPALSKLHRKALAKLKLKLVKRDVLSPALAC